MKTITKVLFIFFLIQSFSCSEDNQEVIEEKFTNPFEHVGKQHNDGLRVVLQNYGERPISVVDIQKKTEQIIRTNTEIEAIYSGTARVSETVLDFPEVNSIDELDFNLWLTDMGISEDLKVAINETLVILETSTSLNEIISSIEQKEIEASSKFSDEQLDLYYSHLAVAKYSAMFWAPEKEGGENGIKYIADSESGREAAIQEINWWKVLGCDCVGGLVGGAAGYLGASAISCIMQL